MNEEKKPKTEPSDDFDNALRTLASAALERDSMPLPKLETKPQPIKNGPTSPVQLMESSWYDVGVFKNAACIVSDFYFSETPINHTFDTSESIPDYSNMRKVELMPGTAYKFRVAALNSCGRGEWSDISAFKTCLPGFPGAPCSIRISRSSDGARLQWDPPTMRSGQIIEYSVCLAIKTAKITSGNISLKDLPFVRVYCGTENNAFVDNSSLKAAYIDKTVKPAIIFRIAARNEKGYGPATQVRWLQDLPSSPSKNGAADK